MNIKLGHTTANDIGWLQSLLGYSVSLTAAALTLTGLVVFSGGFKGDAHSTEQTTRSSFVLARKVPRTASIALDTPKQQPSLQATYYMVSSQTEADLAASLEQGMSQERASIDAPDPRRIVKIFLVTTAAEEHAALRHIAVTDSEGVPFTLVDLRSP
jgi:hypothetical protein